MTAHDRQPYTGPGYADTLLARNMARAGQISPDVRNRFMKQQGRYLAGFGDDTLAVEASPPDTEADSPIGNTPDTSQASLREMEEADDTFGSGLFDSYEAGPTANANLGSFASDYSLPGYAAREVPFAVSRDEVDATSDAPIVTIPSGGLPYVERFGRRTSFPTLGPTARPGGMRTPPSGSKKTDIYVNFQNPEPRTTADPGSAESVGPDYVRTPYDAGIGPQAEVLPNTVARQVLAKYMDTPVPSMSISTVGPVLKPIPVSGFGMFENTSMAEFIGIGAVVGVAAYALKQLLWKK